MRDRSHLVRLFDMGVDAWLAESAEIDRLMKVFDPKEPEQSVYEAQDGEEEWFIAAARVLTTKRGPNAISILRLDQEELSRFQITIDTGQLGTTGVSWVDYRHRNLRATPEQLVNLVRCVAKGCAQGNDLVRRIDKQYIERTLRRLCKEPDCQCPPHVKHIAKWALKDISSIDTDLLNHVQVRQEVLHLEFLDELVRPRAYCLNRGHHEKDWYAAVESMRQEYAAHYLPAITDRFKLK